jgi:hypothetical protein
MPIITALQQHKLNTVAHGIQIIELGLRHLSYAGISCRSPSAAASWWHNAGYIHETDWRHWDTLDPPSCCPPDLTLPSAAAKSQRNATIVIAKDQ